MGSRLRWLADILTRDAAEIYSMYDIDIKSKWDTVSLSVSDAGH